MPYFSGSSLFLFFFFNLHYTIVLWKMIKLSDGGTVISFALKFVMIYDI